MATRTASGTAAWGINGGATGVSGIITSISEDDEPVLAPEYNEAGQVVKQTHYDTKKTVSCTVEVAAGIALPAVGTQVTINGVQGYVVRASLAEDNQSYRKISMTAECYTNCRQVTSV